ncbi:hypothetical protein CYMTET_12867 [Cymbomonas tetramitiformis]|uniref:Uncharacterized protein n=1 Tax=Cymbomonas tetramitiformis TaxID=36881 RepID=A0AAE0GJ74_9CHLO|nr:hypothetical protein CYMTET_12867 [Cymbomonas tetramitiformis]
MPCRGHSTKTEEPFWSEEWKKAGLKATQAPSTSVMQKVLFIETGMGCDQHGSREEHGATKAAIRACRNAIEFNSIPCIQDIVPGGRAGMKIHLKLGIPEEANGVDLDQVRAVFPYGQLLPIEVVNGGLTFQSGRVVEQLGDEKDLAVIVLACVTVGY